MISSIFHHFLRQLEQKYIYRHYAYHPQYQRSFCDGLEEVTIRFRDQPFTHFYRPPLRPTESSRKIICFNGARRTALDWIPVIRQIPEHGFLLIDPPGSGLNPPSRRAGGQKFERALMDMTRKTVRSTFDPADSTDVIGFSMGCGLAARFAENTSARSLILMAPFTNIEQIARRKGSRLATWMGRTGILRTDHWLDSYADDTEGTINIIHGTADKVVPAEMSEELFRQLRTKYGETGQTPDGSEYRTYLHLLPEETHDLLNSEQTARIIASALSRA